MPTLFFSWQSDLPNSTNRNFIEKALKQAIKEIARDTEVVKAQREIELDKDTKGVTGSPPIKETIFEKIKEATVFVPDLSFVGKTAKGRPIPNPNVTIEYGWALEHVGFNGIVGVMNTHYGKPTETTLPFNIRHHKWPIQYELAENADNGTRRAVKEQLVGVLKIAIGEILKTATAEFDGPIYQPLQSKGRISCFLDEDGSLGAYSHWGRSAEAINLGLKNGPQMFLRLIPQSPAVHRTPMELQNLFQSVLPTFLHGRSYGGTSYLMNELGFCIFDANLERSKKVDGVVQICERGEIWAVDCYSMAEGRDIPFFENVFARSLANYMKIAKDTLGIPSQVKIIWGFSGVKGKGVFRPPAPKGHNYTDFGSGAFGSAVKDDIFFEIDDVYLDVPDKLVLQEHDAYKLEADPMFRYAYSILIPSFEKAWGYLGYPRAEHLPNLVTE